MGTQDDSLAGLAAYVRENGRVCPMPMRWHELWEMLPGRRRVGGSWEPPVPLILGGWRTSASGEKMHRLDEHLRYAAEQGCLEQVDRFLRSLPEDEWHHLGE
jgi:hypothetical protein